MMIVQWVFVRMRSRMSVFKWYKLQVLLLLCLLLDKYAKHTGIYTFTINWRPVDVLCLEADFL